MLFNKRFSKILLFVVFVIAIICTSVFFYERASSLTPSEQFDRLPQWMKNQLGGAIATNTDADLDTPDSKSPESPSDGSDDVDGKS
ncbi:DEKNAAC105540 [Brettanomyces naardenensis]|uniref:DEKNAAC105540 n=1 Tax=Brettanomyces naardenensis TaxID=13370 RepID=A0A448YU25_BRENA|nr:DEKNAAC105540 [Brettanomyces naardenensis]